MTSEAGYILLGALALLVIAFLLRMRPRRYYFVRHGQTLANQAHIKQGPEGGLSEAGSAQAEEVGKALAQVKGLWLILASPYLRAQETAGIIAKHLRHGRVRTTTLLAERRNPSEVIGKWTHDPAVERIVDTIDLAYHDDDYRYSDEENFLDMKRRAKRCLRYLERHGARETCVVTHHAFLKMLLCYALYGERITAHEFIKISFYNTSDNGGITVCRYQPWGGRWTIEGYNQSAQN